MSSTRRVRARPWQARALVKRATPTALSGRASANTALIDEGKAWGNEAVVRVQ